MAAHRRPHPPEAGLRFRRSVLRSVRPLALIALIGVASCAPQATFGSSSSDGPGGTAAATGSLASFGTAATNAAPPSATPEPISITDAAYGSLSVTAPPGASCEAAIRVIPGTRGERPPLSISGAVGASGRLDLRYPAPRVPAGEARYDVTCQVASNTLTASARFTVPARPISPASLTVHLVPDRGLADGVVDDPALVPARDAAVARLQGQLAAAWREATRGLGSLALVEDSADIRIVVAAQRGTSVNRTDADSSKTC